MIGAEIKSAKHYKVGGRAPPRPAGGAYQGPLAGLEGREWVEMGGKGSKNGKGREREGKRKGEWEGKRRVGAGPHMTATHVHS